MPRTNFLVLVEQLKEFEFYEIIIKKYLNNIDCILINDELFTNLEFEEFDIVLIDITTKKYLKNLDNIANKEIKDCKFILTTPLELFSYSHTPKNVDFFDLILTKPIDTKKLELFIKNETYFHERKNILEKKDNVLGKVVDLYPSNITVYTLDGVLFYANNNYLKANNLKLQDIDNLTFNDLYDGEFSFQTIKDMLSVNKIYIHQRLDNQDWYESAFYMIFDEFIVHICNNITDQKRKEQQLEQYSIFFENSNEGIMIADNKLQIVSINKAFSRITGYEKNEIIGQKTSILKSGIHKKSFYKDMWESLNTNASWQGEIWNKKKNEEIYAEWLSITKVFNPKYNEEFYMGIFTDISSLKEADKKLYFYANHDVLTKLANRIQFESYLKSSIESCKRNNTKLALFFIDVDKFKYINDTYGHAIGDEMLKTIAKRLEQSIRKEDFIARIGGDEFVLIIKDVKNNNDVLNLANKINDNIKEQIEIEEKVFFMSLSIGISIFPDHGKNSQDLIKFSDVAMYETKENGRNGATLYNEEMSQKILEKMSFQNKLRHAIQKDEFEMFYQSVVQTKSGTIIGAEALVRWNYKQKVVLTPENFIHLIDESGLSIEFGQLVIEKVLKDIQIINSKLGHNNFKVSINISPEHFFRFTFVDELVEYCKKFSISPHQIELEFLETHIMKSSQIANTKFEKLSKLGFSLAIDDFGTGYSSLNYLKKFKVDKLKIAQAFIIDFLQNNHDKVIVEAIINLANIFNLKVQAEGVETNEHQKVLENLNCELAQGYFYSKPIPLSEFIQVLE